MLLIELHNDEAQLFCDNTDSENSFDTHEDNSISETDMHDIKHKQKVVAFVQKMMKRTTELTIEEITKSKTDNK